MVLESCITRQERDTMQFPPILKYFVSPFSSTAFSSVFFELEKVTNSIK